MAKLAEAGKAEQYETLRGWVERTRLNAVGGIPSEAAERFHFDKGDGAIGWLTVEPELAASLKEGKAGIVAFMRHNGLGFAAVPREVCLDVQRVRGEWLRSLAGHEFAPLPLEPTGKKKKRPASAAGAESSSQAASSSEAPSSEAPSSEAPSSEAPSSEAPSLSPSDASSELAGAEVASSE